MPKGKVTPRSMRFKNSKKFKRSRKMRRSRTSFSTTRVPTQLTWYHTSFQYKERVFFAEFTAAMLFAQYKNAFEEMRALGFSITIRPESQMATTHGTYAIVIVDGDSALTSFTWSQNWFKAIACMPGALIRNQNQSVTLNWRPTEPEDRNFFSYDSKHSFFKIAAIFSTYSVQDKLEERYFSCTVSVKGQLLGRSMPWKTNLTKMIAEERLSKVDDDDGDAASFVDVEIKDLSIRSPDTQI